MDYYKERAARTKIFLQDRFGMFIHWGLYAIPARGEWVRSAERMTVEDYQKYFDEFDPIHYEPKKWAALAKRAGMKYAVLTTKHHDGFCLFDSKYTEYKATNTKAKRDLVREYVDAFRAEGIKIGFYYSIIDWYHPDYPAYGDRHHPMRDNPEFDKRHDFKVYLEYMHNQIRELLTNYGEIDIMWFDFSYDSPGRTDEFSCMRREMWEAEKLVKMIRVLQPGIVIDNRLEGSVSDKQIDTPLGDFDSPEQIIPSTGVVDELGRAMPWEACMTLNDNWGYHSKDKNYKTPQNVIHMLIECVSKGGNLLLNVGPDAKGNIPKESVAILEKVGDWMYGNCGSIYGCGKAELEKPEWGRYTQNGKMLYAHVFERGVWNLRFNGLEGKIKKARLLADGSELQIYRPWNATAYPDDAFVNLGTADLSDPLGTVVELELY